MAPSTISSSSFQRLKNAPGEDAVNLSSCPKEEGRDGQEQKLWHLTYASMEVSHVLEKQPHCLEETLKETRRDILRYRRRYTQVLGSIRKEKTGDQRERKSSEQLRKDLQTTKNYVSKASIKDTEMPRAQSCYKEIYCVCISFVFVLLFFYTNLCRLLFWFPSQAIDEKKHEERAPGVTQLKFFTFSPKMLNDISKFIQVGLINLGPHTSQSAIESTFGQNSIYKKNGNGLRRHSLTPCNTMATQSPVVSGHLVQTHLSAS